MAEYFFSVKYADRADLFASLSIWKEEKYRQIQGTFGDRYATMSSWNRGSQRMMRFFWNSKSEIQKKNALWRIRFNMHWHRLQSRIMPPV